MKPRSMSMRVRLAVFLAAAALLGCGAKKPEEHLQAAKAALEKKDTKTATIEIKNALQLNPELAEARFVLGTILLKERNASAAEVELRKALRANHSVDAVVPPLARTLLQLNQAQKLLDEFSASKLTQPVAIADLQTSLATAQWTLGKQEPSHTALTAALAAVPGYPSALLLRARQQVAANDLIGAMATVDQALAKDDALAQAWKIKGDLLRLSDPQRAIVAYQRAISADAQVLPAYGAAISTMLQQGKVDDAAKQLLGLQAVARSSFYTRFLEAQVAYSKGDFKSARDLTQQVLRAEPNNLGVLQLAGATELKLGAITQAEIYLARALQLEPGSTFARNLLISAHLRAGAAQKALAVLDAGQRRGELPPEMYSVAGDTYLANGDMKKAEIYFDKAVKSDPTNAIKRVALARSRLGGGDDDAALKELHEVAATDKGTSAEMALVATLLSKKAYPKALEVVRSLEAKDPKNPMVPILQGRVELMMNDHAAARRSFERASLMDTASFAPVASLASLDMAGGLRDAAKKRLEAFAAKEPKSSAAHIALSKLAATELDQAAVGRHLGRAVEANASDVSARAMLVRYLLQTKDFKQAVSVAQAGVTDNPNSAELLDALGQAQHQAGDLNQATATYGKLAALQPLSPQPHLRMAGAHLAGKDKRAAEASLRKALELKPDLIDAQRGLLLIAMEDGRPDDARRIARAVQQLHPTVPFGYIAEGDVSANLGQWETAVAVYRIGLQKAPATEIAAKLYSSLLTAGKAAEADKVASAWTKGHPDDWSFLAILGDAALVKRDYLGAEKYLQASLKVNPKNALVLNNLAWVMGQLQRDGAMAIAEQAVALGPQQPEFLDTLAELQAKQGDTTHAIVTLNRALTIDPENPYIRLNLARLQVRTKNNEAAMKELRTLEKLGKRFVKHEEVAHLISEASK